MKSILKILLIVGILFLLIGSVSAAINSGFKVPDEFRKSDIWDTAVYDTYCLKNDKNVMLYICEYSEEDYNLYFKDNPGEQYYVTDLGDNIVMSKDNGLNEGYVLEVVEYNGNKYIVHTYLKDNPSTTEIQDSKEYITEFNRLNNLEPITV